MTGSIDHPKHYNSNPSGVECITVIEHMGFNLGNAIKYIWRADEKGNALEDLEKAIWYLKRELARRHNVSNVPQRIVYTNEGPLGATESVTFGKSGSQTAGWVSDNRCGEPINSSELTFGVYGSKPHEAHGYGFASGHKAQLRHPYWCDGYVAPGEYRAATQADLDVIKTVADSLIHGEKRVSPTQITPADGHERNA